MFRWKMKIATGNEAQIMFTSLRGLQSAALLHRDKINLQAADPDRVYMDAVKRFVVGSNVSPTDRLGFTMMNSGMSAQIDIEAKTSIVCYWTATSDIWLDMTLERRFWEASTADDKVKSGRAAHW